MEGSIDGWVCGRVGLIHRLPTPNTTNNNNQNKAPRMLELVLVRHGQSEGNVAYRRSLAGDHSLYSGKEVLVLNKS